MENIIKSDVKGGGIKMEKKTKYIAPKDKMTAQIINPHSDLYKEKGRYISKHNRWIEGMEAGATFFNLIGNIGYGFMILVCVVVAALFLINLGITSPQYLGIVVILLQLLRLGVWMAILGFPLMYLCKWWSEHLYRKELKVIEKEAYGRTNKEAKRN